MRGKIALVAGATRGAGRGIAVALGEAGAIVYCTGRSSRKRSRGGLVTPNRPETIEETAELVTAAGRRGIAARVDHTNPADVKKLAARIKRLHKRLDILVNDVWGGDGLTEFGKPFWMLNLMLKQAIHSHNHHFSLRRSAHRGFRKKKKKKSWHCFRNHGWRRFLLPRQPFYDLVKISVIRLAFAMARELRKRDIVSVALIPGFLRSERVLEYFGVSEANWKSREEQKCECELQGSE